MGECECECVCVREREREREREKLQYLNEGRGEVGYVCDIVDEDLLSRLLFACVCDSVLNFTNVLKLSELTMLRSSSMPLRTSSFMCGVLTSE